MLNKKEWTSLLEKSPKDFELRLVYSDWLEEQGLTVTVEAEAAAWREVANNQWAPEYCPGWDNLLPQWRDKYVWLSAENSTGLCGYAAYFTGEMEARTGDREQSYKNGLTLEHFQKKVLELKCTLPTRLYNRLKGGSDYSIGDRKGTVGTTYTTYFKAELDLIQALSGLYRNGSYPFSGVRGLTEVGFKPA